MALVLCAGCKKRPKDYDHYRSSYGGEVGVRATAVPAIEHAVTDVARVLNANDTESIERELVQHQSATGVQLAVLIVDTTRDQPIEDFSQQVFEAWSGGSSTKNDGALFVLAISDRRNRLHLGYGLEPVIPDAMAKRMLDDLRPHLRDANYAAATRQLVASFRARTAHLDPGEPRKPPLGTNPLMWIAISGLGLVAGFAWAIAFRRGRSAWSKLPMRWGHTKDKPAWYARAGITLVDFFRYPPVGITIAAILGFHLLIRYLFPFHSGVYSLLYWFGIPFGWLIGVKSKVVSISTAVFALAFLISGVAVTGSEALLDGDAVYPVLWPLFTVFFSIGAIGVLPMLIVASGGTSSGGGGGYSYSSSSSSRPSSSSSSSSSRSSSSSSSSSSSRSYSGGGGRSGGGGASSSW